MTEFLIKVNTRLRYIQAYIHRLSYNRGIQNTIEWPPIQTKGYGWYFLSGEMGETLPDAGLCHVMTYSVEL